MTEQQPLKLWTVFLEIEVPVLAATREQATRIGYRGIKEDMCEFDAYPYEHTTRPACGPANWDLDALVYAPPGVDATLPQACTLVFGAAEVDA